MLSLPLMLMAQDDMMMASAADVAKSRFAMAVWRAARYDDAKAR